MSVLLGVPHEPAGRGRPPSSGIGGVTVLRWSRALALLLCPLLLVVACARPAAPGAPAGTSPASTPAQTPSPTPEPVDVIFMAGFKPQANLPFAAVYLAQERGYFAEQGLRLQIQHSAGGGEHVRLLGVGHVHFSTGSVPDILKRVAASEVPLVAIALIGQKGEQAFAVLEDSDIRTPKDWEGRVVGVKGAVPTADYLAILQAAGVDRDKVSEVSVGFDPRILVERRVDVYPVFVSNEPYVLERIGHPVRLFRAEDFGITSLGLTLMTNRQMVEERPEVVRRFLAAALRGLNEAVADPEAALDAVMAYAVGEDREHQRWMLEREIEGARTALTEREGLGSMTREQWEAQQRVLLEFEVIERPVDLDLVQTDRFLRELYRDGRLVWP